MSETSLRQALDFLENEKQFQLGFLPTEQSSPLTRRMDEEFARSTVRGIANLQSVDRNVLAMARDLFASPGYTALTDAAEYTLRQGGRIIFSGCGATGRLSILLESMWRQACADLPAAARYADQVASIMTGGDYALVRAVEFFEDHQSFGRRQAAEMNVNDRDMLVAITEGGETSSVLGTLFEAADRGAKIFLLFNNPAPLLAARLERSAKAINDPRVTVLDLHCGPMALAGSTRMQATTSEQLIAGSALETAFCRLTGVPSPDHLGDFSALLDDLESTPARTAMADYLDFEADLYRRNKPVTYFANDFMLDIFTDTTERTPTFKLPPFRKNDDTVSPPPWALVKNPLFPTADVWEKTLHRDLRCLAWLPADYRAMNAPAAIIAAPPRITAPEMLKFEVGCEPAPDRTPGAAVLFTVGDRQSDEHIFDAFTAASAPFACRKHLALGGSRPADFPVACRCPHSPLRTTCHLAAKLLLNTISTGVMVQLGRVTGNWMSFVDVTNKKLTDRAIRLISEIGGLDYRESCIRLYDAVEKLAALPADAEKPSAVQYVLRHLAPPHGRP